jgi:hypothetical protein
MGENVPVVVVDQIASPFEHLSETGPAAMTSAFTPPPMTNMALPAAMVGAKAGILSDAAESVMTMTVVVAMRGRDPDGMPPGPGEPEHGARCRISTKMGVPTAEIDTGSVEADIGFDEFATWRRPAQSVLASPNRAVGRLRFASIDSMRRNASVLCSGRGFVPEHKDAGAHGEFRHGRAPLAVDGEFFEGAVRQRRAGGFG